ncbi:MAG: helicase-related protein [Parerythrobacter sp.]
MSDGVTAPSRASLTAVLGPTNTGKTHLAIERMCAHASGTIGFPLRLLAREVYDRVVAIKGEKHVALITGEERIAPPTARYFCCTAEAMPRDAKFGGATSGPAAFVALDEAQLGANRERGHIFTDRLLHTRGREETMVLGAGTLAPMVRALEPDAEIIERPRFSTLTHAGSAKLSRLAPRSAIVAFSAEQVYAVAEMLRRFRGGSAVVMGALSPETRNRQVELFQSGEVDYIVATDAIGMGLNLDIRHVAFATLTKFDGMRQRRLMPAEMAQIAGRAGRHQTDGSFGTLSGMAKMRGGHDAPAAEFDEEEIYAIEEHRFAPITKLFWRNAEPRFGSLDMLIADLEQSPHNTVLRTAPEAVDLAVLKRLAATPIAEDVRGAGSVRRFWEACSLPDFRQAGADTHARFVARLWQDLRSGYLGADYVASRISELDRMQGDIHALQGRIAAIRSWAYICQRPDWVLARDEMAARARGVEARLSDALHARLTERFVNRRTAVLMKSLGQDAALLPVSLSENSALLVDGETIGHVEGFRFTVDASARLVDRKLLLAAGERALPRILAEQARTWTANGHDGLALKDGALYWEGQRLASIHNAATPSTVQLVPTRNLAALPPKLRESLLASLTDWLVDRLQPLKPLERLSTAAADAKTGSHARAVLLTLIAHHGVVTREAAGLEHLPKELRPFLRRLGVVFGALDVFVPALLKPAPRKLFADLALDHAPLHAAMTPVVAAVRPLPAGYRAAGRQAVRVDIAEKLLHAAHDARGGTKERRFLLDPALAISTGLTLHSYRALLRAGGFRHHPAPKLAPGTFGPAQPDRHSWRPNRRTRRAPNTRRPVSRPDSPFAALADLAR